MASHGFSAPIVTDCRLCCTASHHILSHIATSIMLRLIETVTHILVMSQQLCCHAISPAARSGASTCSLLLLCISLSNHSREIVVIMLNKIYSKLEACLVRSLKASSMDELDAVPKTRLPIDETVSGVSRRQYLGLQAFRRASWA